MKRLKRLSPKAIYTTNIVYNPIRGVYGPASYMVHLLDWCIEHQSKGKFYFAWTINRKNLELIGTFKFTESDDHLLFSMTWA